MTVYLGVIHNGMINGKTKIHSLLRLHLQHNNYGSLWNPVSSTEWEKKSYNIISFVTSKRNKMFWLFFPLTILSLYLIFVFWQFWLFLPQEKKKDSCNFLLRFFFFFFTSLKFWFLFLAELEFKINMKPKF